eukprot:6205376-Pleurochrysis_carterae.AAC.6
MHCASLAKWLKVISVTARAAQQSSLKVSKTASSQPWSLVQQANRSAINHRAQAAATESEKFERANQEKAEALAQHEAFSSAKRATVRSSGMHSGNREEFSVTGGPSTESSTITYQNRRLGELGS